MSLAHYNKTSYDSPHRTRVGLPPGPVFVVLGVLSGLYFWLTGTVWAVTGEFTRLGGHVVAGLGADISQWQYFAEVTTISGSPLERTDGWIVVAMLLGSLIAALAAGDFRLRFPRLKRRWVQALCGGIIAGFGARLAFGCNLAAMFTGIPQFSLHAWIFTLFTAVGTWVGVQIIKQRWWRGPTRPQPANQEESATAASSRTLHVAIAVVLAVATLGAAVWYLTSDRTSLAVAVVFGLAFGVLIQRGQICFTAAFRDLWVTRKTKLADSLVLGLAAAVVVTFVVLLATDAQPLTKPAGWGTVIGGFLFGLGIIFAGACETGMMYRAMEGQLVAWVAFAGNIVGATVLAYGWDHWGIHAALVANAPKINFYDAWGPWPALVASLAALAVWWVAMSPRRADRKTRLESQYQVAASPERSLNDN
ncbi:selenium metabolism membrane protein YedE/FdhT [Corynebacterium lizhenjunii]|uniref:selenium metabolism membrane protein YedE/FdhT n=1 Tax=Corynebacterium lizhenjunii TaxID=2709394 RepID=UPI0013ECC20B|nr:selenium metabolism membrane protein YedE/FdhT [Corynebacterium lizhenjunii]